jgi:small subunit ribosomal protein S27Ae
MRGVEMPKTQYYEVKDGKIVRNKRTCPKCGDGVFLAEHSNRMSCGKCGYTEFKRKEKPKKEKKEKAPLPDTGAPSLFDE